MIGVKLDIHLREIEYSPKREALPSFVSPSLRCTLFYSWKRLKTSVHNKGQTYKSKSFSHSFLILLCVFFNSFCCCCCCCCAQLYFDYVFFAFLIKRVSSIILHFILHSLLLTHRPPFFSCSFSLSLYGLNKYLTIHINSKINYKREEDFTYI